MGWGAGVGGAPGIPSLVFLERLNGKRLANGRSPMQPQGAQKRWHPLHQNPYPIQDCSPSGGPAAMYLPRPRPLWGEIKVQTVVPLWAERHQGGGVAPGCKALAEAA